MLCSFTKRARGSQQPPCKDLPKPSQLGSRPLTLRLLNAPALLHSKKYSQAHWQYFCVELIHLLARLPLRLFLVYIK
ncbi:hypothetical protein EQK34_00345 [Lacticaseibacillus paracasei]|nr:hypothetical protein EQK34_00345 [Lacticaseibacillus paracasei]